MFVLLEPFAERASDPQQSAGVDRRRAVRAGSPAIEEAFMIVVQPPPVQGIGNAGGFRMMIEDRGGRGSAGAAGRGLRHDGQGGADARAHPGVLAVRDLDAAALSRHRPHQGAAAGHQHRRMCSPRCRSISARPTSTTSTCSAAPSACRRRPTSQYRLDPHDVLKIRVRNTGGDTVPLGAFTTVRDIVRARIRVPRYNLYPAAELDGAAAPGYSQGQAIQIMEKLAAETLPRGLRVRMDDARLPADPRRQHRDLRLRARRRLRLPGAGRAVRKPDAAARRHHDRADVSGRGDHRASSSAGRTTTSSRRSASSC